VAWLFTTDINQLMSATPNTKPQAVGSPTRRPAVRDRKPILNRERVIGRWRLNGQAKRRPVPVD